MTDIDINIRKFDSHGYPYDEVHTSSSTIATISAYAGDYSVLLYIRKDGTGFVHYFRNGNLVQTTTLTDEEARP